MGFNKFTRLRDTPDSYDDQAGKFPKVKETEDGLEFGVAGAGKFTELTDTPDSYNYQEGKLVAVEKVTRNKEDFTDYTQELLAEDITVTANKITFVDVNLNRSCWVYKDAGVNHFSGDFEHKLTVCCTAQDLYGVINPWTLANMEGDQKAIMDADQRQLNLSFVKLAPYLTLRIYERNGASMQDDWVQVDFNKKYYLTIKRDESIGTYGRLYVYIYTDPERTELLDTLQLDLWDKTDYRYVYAFQTYNIGLGYNSSGYVENLYLQEETQPDELKFIKKASFLRDFLNYQDVTASRALDTVYRNTAGKWKIIIAYLNLRSIGPTGTYAGGIGYIGSTSPPSTNVGSIYARTAVSAEASSGTYLLIFFVPDEYYYKITSTASGGTVSLSKWMEIEFGK